MLLWLIELLCTKIIAEATEGKSCFIDTLLNDRGITTDKLKYYLIGLGVFIFLLLVSVIVTASCLCCVCAKYKRKKAKVHNICDMYDDEHSYAKFLEFQRRYNETVQPQTIQLTGQLTNRSNNVNNISTTAADPFIVNQ